MTLYEQILELFPLVSYEQNRKESGHVVPAEETDRRELTEGVTYRKCRYRLGDGKDVWVYLTEVAPAANARAVADAILILGKQ